MNLRHVKYGEKMVPTYLYASPEEKVNEIVLSGRDEYYGKFLWTIHNRGFYPCVYIEIPEYINNVIHEVYGKHICDNIQQVNITFDGPNYPKSMKIETHFTDKRLIIGWNYAHTGDYMCNAASNENTHLYTLSELLDDINKVCKELYKMYENAKAELEKLSQTDNLKTNLVKAAREYLEKALNAEVAGSTASVNFSVEQIDINDLATVSLTANMDFSIKYKGD